MRNLNRLTHAANRLENGPNPHDRRKYPKCAESGCRRRVNLLPDDNYTAHCDRHWTEDEKRHYFKAWKEAQ